jgi:hypothetical protein
MDFFKKYILYFLRQYIKFLSIQDLKELLKVKQFFTKFNFLLNLNIKMHELKL